MNKGRNILVSLVALILVLAGGFGIWSYTDNQNEEDEVEQVTEQKLNATITTVNSDGVQTDYPVEFTESQTALDIMDQLKTESDFTFETQQFDFGIMINSINDLKPESNEFISVFVNDEFAQVGVSELKLKEGDVLKFEIEKIN